MIGQQQKMVLSSYMDLYDLVIPIYYCDTSIYICISSMNLEISISFPLYFFTLCMNNFSFALVIPT